MACRREPGATKAGNRQDAGGPVGLYVLSGLEPLKAVLGGLSASGGWINREEDNA